MDRLQKKCLIASSGFHGLLLLTVLFGAAFVPNKTPPPVESLTMVPSKLIDAALSGGGGNPNIPRSEAKIKGETLEPVKPQPEPPKPKPEVPRPKAVEQPKPAPPKAEPVKSAMPKIDLKPITKKPGDRAKTEPKPRDQAAARQKELAKAFGEARKTLKQGFSSGTAVEVSGPGGEAYASYRSFVFAAYDNAWQVQPDIADEESAVQARVIVHRTGRIISAEIIKRSGNAALDKSVSRALHDVEKLPPFPETTRDQERTFTIEFSLK